MTPDLLADMLTEALKVPDLACTTEREPSRPGCFYVYADGSILRVDVHAVAVHPARRDGGGA